MDKLFSAFKCASCGLKDSGKSGPVNKEDRKVISGLGYEWERYHEGDKRRLEIAKKLQPITKKYPHIKAFKSFNAALPEDPKFAELASWVFFDYLGDAGNTPEAFPEKVNLEK